ncbi:hypothetical protein [Sandaracinus amylolyticus]|uniref:Tryptophan synthase alpha chain n=1 Tax=Sandaracinus amylolyticus TaxID=927083 RepID=A0A0F6YL15_9BACT|nr:hypothetical protein [Sandaracinus amylolyticus]AKF09335.1 Tryptophan synthase alpha chain [Sandaracinus amylolyticus]
MRRPLSLVLVALAAWVVGCEAEGFRIRDTGVRIDPPECFDLGDCDDGIECTSDDCAGLRCYHGRPPGFCPGSACVPDHGGCASSVACTSDLDCADDDACTADERCELGSCTVRYLGDRDGDGDLQPECGGGDCDDADAHVSIYADEQCDGRDEDCDGDVDESSCGLGQCVNGACVCPEGTAICEGACVDNRTDVEHCGTCGVSCASGGVCDQGACACPIGLELCAEQNACNTIGTTPRSCGVCRVSCDDGTQCIDGECICPDDFLTCRGLCVDPRSNREHCGACGVSCQWCEECVEGACVPRADATLCDGICTRLLSDARNCGECGHACAADESCSRGACICSGAYCDGVCTPTRSDPANCGGCGVVCPAGSRCEDSRCGCVDCDVSGGRCADVSFDADHCGGCDLACPIDQGCVDGVCVASTSCVTRDGGDCIDAVIDLRPRGGSAVCREMAYEWCPRAPGIAGVVRLDNPYTVESDRNVPLALAAARQGVCATTLGYVVELDAYGGVSWCFDPQGRSGGAAIIAGGGATQLLLDATQPGLSPPWLVSTRATAAYRVVTARTPADDWRLIGVTVVGEAVASAARGGVIAGTFSGAISPPCSGSAECVAHVTARGGTDGYVAFTGPEPRLVTVGGPSDDAVHTIVGVADDVVIAGSFRGSWDGLVSHGASDAFVARMRGDGSYVWRVAIGGASEDEALRVVEHLGAVIVAGRFSGSITIGDQTITAPRPGALFLAALRADTGAPSWARAIDARPWDLARDVDAILESAAPPIALPLRLGLAASASEIAITADFTGTIDLAGTSLTSVGASDVLVARFASDDGRLLAARGLGGVGEDHAADVAIDDTGTAWIAAHLGAPMSLGAVSIGEGAVLIGVLP